MSNIKLKYETYMGSIKFAVVFKYSFIILSSAEILLLFNELIHFNISPSVIDEFNSSSSSELSKVNYSEN